MDVKELVIHKLEKKQLGNAKLVKAKKSLKVGEIHTNFMDEVKNVYFKKSNPTYGVFDKAVDSYPYQKFLQLYLDKKETFFKFTERAVEHFGEVINEIPQATGGYILFCHYYTTDDFVATIVLNDKASYIVDETLDIKSNFQLDIEKLDVANFTNCSRWSSAEDVYLSFTKGKKEVSNYFKKFIGCTDFTSAKESSENLKKALADFFTDAGYEKKQVEEIKTKIFSHCEQKIRNKEDINIEVLSALIDETEPSKFKEFASAEKYQLSTTFRGHRTLRSLKYYSYKSRDLTIEFDSKLLGKQVVYNEKNNNLLIKDIPEYLKDQLTKKIEDDDSE